MRLHTSIAALFIVSLAGVLHADNEPDDSDAEALQKVNEDFYAALNAMFDGNLELHKYVK